MSRAKRVGDLQLEQHPKFQARDWAAQRVGWAMMVLIMAAALAGFFGRGPAARGAVGEIGAPLRVEYHRLIRHGTEDRLTLRLAHVPAGERGLLLDSALLSAIRIRRMTPQPVRTEAVAGGVLHTFAFAGPTGERTIAIDYMSERYWSQSGALTLEGQRALSLPFFVFP